MLLFLLFNKALKMYNPLSPWQCPQAAHWMRPWPVGHALFQGLGGVWFPRNIQSTESTVILPV